MKMVDYRGASIEGGVPTLPMTGNNDESAPDMLAIRALEQIFDCHGDRK
jgi:hypothetical protein